MAAKKGESYTQAKLKLYFEIVALVLINVLNCEQN